MADSTLAGRSKRAGLETIGTHTPLLLDDPARAWRVEAGEVAVFAVAVAGGVPVGPRHYAFSARPGDVLLGMDLAAGGPPLGYLAVPLADTRVAALGLDALEAQARDPASADQVAAALDRWVAALEGGLVGGRAPHSDAQLVPAQAVALAEGQTARPLAGVVWVQGAGGNVRFLDEEPLAAPFPLAESAWLRAAAAAELVPLATADALARGAAWPGLVAFHQAVRACQQRRLAAAAAAESARLRAEAAHDRAVGREALGDLSALLERRPRAARVPPGETPLQAACALVGAAFGVAVQSPPPAHGEAPRDELAAIAKASRLRTRPVTLPPDWWQRESGPLLGYRAADGQPLALLPAGRRRYDLVDPVAGTRVRVDQDVARQVAAGAHVLYRPLPDGALGSRDLVRFALHDCKADLLNVLLLGALGGLLSMAIPIATGLVFGAIIPNAERSQLLQVA